VRATGLIHRIGVALIAAGAVLFVYSFFRTATGSGSGTCSGEDCLKGDMLWAVLVPVSILVAVCGFLLVYFAGRGYGRTHGPQSFAEVDSGAWAPGERDSQTGDRLEHGRRWTRTWRNIYVAVGLGELGLALLFVLAAVAKPAVRRGFVPTAVVLGLVGAVCLTVGWRAARKDRLHETGLKGEATIVGLEQSGLWMNENPYVRLELVVHVPGHPEYEVKHGEIVPQIALGRLTNGASLPIKVDPDRPSHLLVEWERL
jgi:hypothetical protein